MTLKAGARLGPYEVLSPLGAGGMGEVFRARDTRLGREVAIKLLPPAFASDPERLARFEREAKLLAALNHPSITHLYGLEEAGGRPFLVLELADGEDLSARLARGRLPADEAVAIARQVAEALEAAHEKGIVHRDLKPGNVKVAPDGQVKVLDFGLARAWEGEAAGPASGAGALSQSPTLAHSGTAAGVILGTAAYMSPEQARGKPVDKRADVWAFGVVLFEMLTGRRLFDGETVTDVLAAVVRQEVDWDALPPETPTRVRRLLRRCLEREARLRLRDIGEARIALAGPDEPAPAAPPARAGLSRRAALTLAAGAGAGAFALGYGLGRRSGAAAGRRPEPLSVDRITSSGNVISATISPDGRFVCYVESEQGEQSLWLRQLATGQTLRLLPPRPPGYWSHRFTPDGNSIVFGLKGPGDYEGSLWSISALGGAPRRLVGGIDSPPTFSPDGRRMAWLRANHPGPEESALVVAGSDGKDARVLASVKLPERVAPIFFTAPDWSPDGRRVAMSVVRLESGAVERDARLVAVSVEDGTVETLADPGWRSAAQVAWLPDGSGLLAIASAPGAGSQVWLVPLPRGEPRRVTNDLLEYRIVSLTADGSSLVTVGAEILASVWLAPLDGRERPRRVTSSRLDGIFGVAFAPDGRVVYTQGRAELWIATADGGDSAPLPAGDGDKASPVCTRSGTLFYLARTASSTEIRRLSLDGQAPAVVARDVSDPDFAVSPDERRVVYGGLREGRTRLLRVDVAGGTPEPVTDGLALIPAFSPDGQRLACYVYDGGRQRIRIAIVPAQGGPPRQSIDVESPTNDSRIVLRDEGLYLNTMPGDRANVWLQPLDGRPARRLTDFQDGTIYDFAVSPDGRSLAYSRGPRTRDAVLVRGFR